MVWSAGGSGGLTTEQLDAALDSTSRNLLRVSTTTITTANQSTTSAGYGWQKLTTTTITAQGGSPDFDFNTNFQMCAITSTLTLVNETTGGRANGRVWVDQVIAGQYTAVFAASGPAAINDGDTPVTYTYPLTGSFVGLPTSIANHGDIFIEIYGYVGGTGGTTVITDISHKCWGYRGA